MAEHLSRLWIGIDAGKAHHWLAAVDETGATIWSKKVPADLTRLCALVGTTPPIRKRGAAKSIRVNRQVSLNHSEEWIDTRRRG
ncbi:IS110 family transposase [Streptomyces sp. SudanB52_2052]|uniref:IS110 family transposase n=1 Tax=Streptomyces sp. SudanB52_2052 TaxID=3035276 RepID=UPI003F57A8B5